MDTNRIDTYRIWRLVVPLMLVASWAQPAPAQWQWGGYTLVAKMCESCGGRVPLAADVGDRCPYCGVRWSARRTQVIESPTQLPGMESPLTALPMADRAPVQPKAPEPLTSPMGRWKAWLVPGLGVRVRAVDGGRNIELAHIGPVVPGMFGPNDASIVTVDGRGQVRILTLPDLRPGSPVIAKGAWGALFTPDGDVMVAKDQVVLFRNPKTGAPTGPGVLSAGGRKHVETAWVSEDGTRVSVRVTGGLEISWDVDNGKSVQKIDASERVPPSDGRLLSKKH